MHDFQGVFSMLTLARSAGNVSPEELYEKAGQVLWHYAAFAVGDYGIHIKKCAWL